MIIKNESQKLRIPWRLVLKNTFIASFLVLFFITLINIDFIKVYLFKQQVSITPVESFFSDSVEISMSAPIRADIFYTTDGSKPTTSSNLYADPFTISDNTVIRFSMFKNNKQIGESQSKDIFINSPHDLPIISMATNPENLWDENTGIYHLNNFEKRGADWAREAVISFYEPDKTHVFTQKASVRLHGSGSRLLPQKSFRLSFNNVENGKTLNYPVFPENEVSEFDTLVLRNGGGDWSYTHMRDALMQELIEDTNLDLELQDYRPAVLYLNGEYWGIYNIRERQDREYISHKYNTPANTVSIHTSTEDFGVSIVEMVLDEGDDTSGLEKLNNLIKEAKNDCVGCVNISGVEKVIDWQNFRDYMLVYFHFNNFDWPYNNFKTWRYETQIYEPNAPKGLDGRFRWLVFDMDVGFGFGKEDVESMKNSAKTESIAQKLIDDKFPFRNLIKNSDFYIPYLMKYADLLNKGFDSNTVISKIDELASQIDSEMPRQIERWHHPETWTNTVPEHMLEQTTYIKDYDQWRDNLDLLKVYAQDRPDEMRKYLVKEFDLSGMSKITLDVNDPEMGYIKINSLNLNDVAYPWTGLYFKDLTIKMEAIPKAGYEFVGWESDGRVNGNILRVNVNEDSTHTAIFK